MQMKRLTTVPEMSSVANRIEAITLFLDGLPPRGKRNTQL
jgi:hypothetical protein